MDTKFHLKSRRILTEEQLIKRRRTDKLKHRENRAENKTRLENIERDVSFLRNNIGELMLQLRQTNLGIGTLKQSRATLHSVLRQQNHHHDHHYHPYQHNYLHQNAFSFKQPVCPPATESWSWPRGNTASPLTLSQAARSISQVGQAFHNPLYDRIAPQLYVHHIFPQQPLMEPMDFAPQGQLRGHEPANVKCHCGGLHSVDIQCIERVSVITAIEFKNASEPASLQTDSSTRNPSLTDMLLHHSDMSNPLVVILSTILRQYDFSHVDSLCGIFLLAYRLIWVRCSEEASMMTESAWLLITILVSLMNQWRYYPSSESLADVPSIMRPTQAQIAIAHPKCIDFLPFPALRNHLCLHQDTDSRHSVDLYLRSMRLTLPPGKSLMCELEHGYVELHPEFEMLASDLRNWDIGLPWSGYFPQLRQFLN